MNLLCVLSGCYSVTVSFSIRSVTLVDSVATVVRYLLGLGRRAMLHENTADWQLRVVLMS